MGRRDRFKSALVALVTSIALVAGLVPTQALAEAVDELAAQAQDAGIEAMATDGPAPAGDAEKPAPAAPSDGAATQDGDGAEVIAPAEPAPTGAVGEAGQVVPAESDGSRGSEVVDAERLAEEAGEAADSDEVEDELAAPPATPAPRAKPAAQEALRGSVSVESGYTVRFDANVPASASTECSGTMDEQVFAVDEKKVLSANAYFLPGYDFAGWNTKADGSGASYADGAEVQNLTGDGGTVTLYAQWSAKAYTIVFDPGEIGGNEYRQTTDVGTAAVTVRGRGNFIGAKTVTFNITPKPLAVTAETKSKTYGEADPELTYTADGLTSGDTITGKLTRAAGESVDGYDISEAEVSDIPDQIYAGTEITPEPTVTWNGKTLVKGTDYTLDYADNIDAGIATVTVTGCGNSYSTQTTTFKITSKALTVTALPQTYPYNGQIQGEGDTAYEDPADIAEKVSVEGLCDGDMIGSLVLDGQGTDVGGYELVVSNVRVANAAGDTVTGNYDIDRKSGTLTIEPAKVTITVDSASKMEGDSNPTFTGTVEGLVADDDLGEVKFVRTGSDEAPGTYEDVLTATYTENKNYEVTVVPGDFTIKKALTARWLDAEGGVLQEKTYAEGDPVPAYDGADPTKPATAQYSYAFSGWDEGTVEEAVTTYAPLFDATVNEYDITFDLAGGTLDGARGTVTWTRMYGSTIILPKPAREGYVFKYWRGSRYDAGAKYTVKGAHTLTAVWEKKPAPNPASPTRTTVTTTKNPIPQTGDPSAGASAGGLALASGLCLVLAGIELRKRRVAHEE